MYYFIQCGDFTSSPMNVLEESWYCTLRKGYGKCYNKIYSSAKKVSETNCS